MIKTPEIDNFELRLFSFIKSSKQRVKMLMAFNSSVTPSEVSRITGLSPSHVTRSLKEFCDKEIMKYSNPKSHIGKLYALTEGPRGYSKEVFLNLNI